MITKPQLKLHEINLFGNQNLQEVLGLNQYGFNVIVITNQSMIGRNMVSREVLDAIFKKMKKGVQKAGGRVGKILCRFVPPKEFFKPGFR